MVMFDSQEYRQDRPQGLQKTSKNLGMVAAQCNGIAACAYSLKYTYSMVLTQVYCTWSVVYSDLFSSFIWTNGPQIILF